MTKRGEFNRLIRWAGLGVAAVVSMVTVPAFASNFGKGTYGTCTYSTCGITLSTSTLVGVNVTPTSTGKCTDQKDVVSVQTSNSSGYVLTMKGTTATAALVNGANTIPSTTATQASPATLPINTWGYRVDGVGGFGVGPTTVQSNVTSIAQTFARIPNTSQSADTIASTAVSANPAVTTNVWYGLCLNTIKPAGAYVTQVLYTAITN